MAFTNDTIYSYLPRYYQIEANNLKALQPGFVVSQITKIDADADFAQVENQTVATSVATKANMIANGHIVAIDATKGITDAAADSKAVYIVYNEPIVKFGPADDYALYATNTDEECLRLVQLIPGDEWTCDAAMDVPTLGGRIVEVTAASKLIEDDFIACDTLADGTPAKHYIFLG